MNEAEKSALQAKILEIDRRLAVMYGAQPWQPRLNPLDEMIFTILSQNNTDVNAWRAFERLQERFADWEAVADAPEADISEAIRIGGLADIKASWIKAALQRLQREEGRVTLDFICTMEEKSAWEYLLSFKGIGLKTAAIILLFACGRPAFPVDTHVFRVSLRLGLIARQGGPGRAQLRLQEIIPPELYYQLHVNMVLHGRQICRARRPLCARCLLRDICPFYLQNLHGEESRF